MMAGLGSSCVLGLISLFLQHNHLVSLDAINRSEVTKSFKLKAACDGTALSSEPSDFDVRLRKGD